MAKSPVSTTTALLNCLLSFTGDKHKVENTVSQRIFVKFEMTSVGYSGAQEKMIYGEKNKSKEDLVSASAFL
jgi:hypothetical protein